MEQWKALIDEGNGYYQRGIYRGAFAYYNWAARLAERHLLDRLTSEEMLFAYVVSHQNISDSQRALERHDDALETLNTLLARLSTLLYADGLSWAMKLAACKLSNKVYQQLRHYQYQAN
ncbi:hypothetical protein [Aliagarivorans marinus]|uniref:hypothetical protein n=1 Tax=Aliagarivorans marinus TaxID=561965 RepID=UPI0004017DE1|nr:hypothetical protein [Aliagarivorans marinus]